MNCFSILQNDKNNINDAYDFVKLHSLRVELLPLLKIEEDEEEDVKLCNANNSGKLLIYKVAKHDRITAQYSEDVGADKWRNRFNGRANYIISSQEYYIRK